MSSSISPALKAAALGLSLKQAEPSNPSVKVSLKLLKSNLSNLLRLMGDILYIVCKYNSFLPNPDSVELDFLQRIKSVHIAFLVLNGDFWSFGWLFV